jgi:hypothetical protein
MNHDEAQKALDEMAEELHRMIKAEEAKELTDEEITQCLNDSMETKNVWGQPMSELNPIVFARAVIQKTKEKQNV